ncbi:LytR/AlgR family response regulator transcription factor [Mucilaginibacter sp. KACC 22063]|uniref:LytR/AlgR family response regulator transcription factor n=1 Tax=Mucilaginibacter sp. KACC 22063 TaxID=3025666 RepID=UPI0023672E48|nr:LytTR family DNA-binding domain-containing protein [Mucilaginibacter sp. KACC 22063]WDF56067.1 LytTR family DNA-binding domain-containing protein [Mucilaginibacter sp. KACC 22063]
MQVSTIKAHLLNEISYPHRYKSSALLKTVSIQFAVIFFFLLLFKPFGVSPAEQRFGYAITCALHAFFPAVIIYSYFFALGRFYQNSIKPRTWTLLREYIHIAVIFFLIGIASFLLRKLVYNNPDNWSWYYLWEEIRNCYLAGVLFYFILLISSAYFEPDTKTVQITNADLSTANEGNANINTDQVFIKTQVQQDDFHFNPAQLLFAKADGNYITLTLCTDNHVSAELKRISLKQFELQVSDYPFLFRCHRAYLVNLLQVTKFSGNAQGYILSLNATDEKVPVSRSQVEIFEETYKRHTGIAYS